MRLLSPVDQMFARMETARTPMHIGALAIFELPTDADSGFPRRLHEAFSELAYLPFPFDSVIAGGGTMAWWKRVAPDPSYHVRLSALPAPGTDRELGALVERLHSYPLDMSKPLWEAHVIEGLADNRFAFYFKAHHCAVDGMGAMDLIKRWLTTDPSGVPGSESAPWPGTGPSVAGAFAATAARRARDGVIATSEITGRLTTMLRGANSSVLAALRTPRTPFNTRITRHRRLAVQVLELPRLKRVATTTGTTVNDVVLASLGGAVRTYLAEQDALPRTSLTVSVPVGIDRDADTLNAAAGFVAPLGSDAADPLARLHGIAAATSRGKAELLALSPNALQHYTLAGLVPLAIGQRTGVLGVIPPLFNFTVSNVVLSKEPLYLSGARLDLIVPVSFLCDGYGLNVTLVGYTDRVALGFVGCRDTLPHLQRLAQYTGSAFDDLEAASASV